MMSDRPREAAPHPEDWCGRCGGPNLKTWHAPSPLWNTVMRAGDGTEAFDGIVCPRCFGELAREKGVADYFCVTTHDAKVPLPATFGDGRVWDAARCQWVEREAAERATAAVDVERLRRSLVNKGYCLWDNDAGYVIEDADLNEVAAEYARLSGESE